MIKKCSKCGILKDRGEFYGDKYTKDGLCRQCKDCHLEYRQTHKKEISENHKRWYKKNKPKKDAQNREWYFNHEEHMQEYRENRKEEMAEYGKERYQLIREKRLAQVKEYHQEKPEVARKANRKRRDRKKFVNEKNLTVVDEKCIKELFDHRCFRCGDIDHLQIDHHYPLAAGYPLTRDNAVLLCRSCNASKGAKLPKDFYDEAMLDELEHILGINE
jgi:5-methylcytosine-specific restriction endonuclease McrA